MVAARIGVVLVSSTALLLTRGGVEPAGATGALQYKIYLPVVAAGSPPDPRFGLAEYTVAEMVSLGFPDDGRYVSQQWGGDPDERSSAYFLRPASLDYSGTWCLTAYRIAGRPDRCADPTGNTVAVADGWYDEAGMHAFVQGHTGRAWIVGNEALCGEPCGDGLSPTEYARWHHAAYTSIKGLDPAARVGQWGTIGLGDGNVAGGGGPEEQFLLDFWAAYQQMYGQPLPSDFFSVHHYAWPGWELEVHTQALVDWIGWLETHRGTDWAGPRDYWLTEFGMPAWRTPIDTDEALRYMDAIIPWLMTHGGQYGISMWSWWPSCNVDWPDQCVNLIEGGMPTLLGQRYHELALSQEVK